MQEPAAPPIDMVSYAGEIKSSLGKDASAQFKSLLKDWTQRTADIDSAMQALVDGLGALFAHRPDLFSRFRGVLPPVHQPIFDRHAPRALLRKESKPLIDPLGDPLDAGKKRPQYQFAGHQTVVIEKLPGVFRGKESPRKEAGHGCGKCGKRADKPFKASCGHVCCYECWVSTLREKAVCPVAGCGAATATKDLKKMYLM